MSKDYGQDCPLARTAEIVAERWTPLILRQLFAGRCRFSQFTEDLTGISPRLLTARLRSLEAHGIITRCVYAGPPSRVEYCLTELGQALRILMLAMNEWGVQYCTEARPVRLVHTACGAPAHIEVHCTSCHDVLPIGEVTLESRNLEDKA